MDKDIIFIRFEDGDEVLVKANNVPDSEMQKITKFFSMYEGPCSIPKKIGEATYLIDDKKEKERGRFHAALLKKYNQIKEPAIEEAGQR